MGTDALQEYVQIFFTDGTGIQGRDPGEGFGGGGGKEMGKRSNIVKGWRLILTSKT